MNDPFNHPLVGTIFTNDIFCMECTAWHEEGARLKILRYRRYGGEWVDVENGLHYTNPHDFWIRSKYYTKAFATKNGAVI